MQCQASTRNSGRLWMMESVSEPRSGGRWPPTWWCWCCCNTEDPRLVGGLARTFSATAPGTRLLYEGEQSGQVRSECFEGKIILPLLSRSSQVGARPKWTSRGSLSVPFSASKQLATLQSARTHLLRNHVSVVLIENIGPQFRENIFTGRKFYQCGEQEEWREHRLQNR